MRCGVILFGRFTLIILMHLFMIVPILEIFLWFGCLLVGTWLTSFDSKALVVCLDCRVLVVEVILTSREFIWRLECVMLSRLRLDIAIFCDIFDANTADVCLLFILLVLSATVSERMWSWRSRLYCMFGNGLARLSCLKLIKWSISSFSCWLNVSMLLM